MAKLRPERPLGPVPLTPAGFAELVPVSRETLARLERYAALLIKWNRAINLVSRASLADLWRRHMLDSAQLLEHLPAPPQGRPRVIADLGSGAGFPGLVLAILGAGQVHLIEADQRKATFLREVGRETDCPVTVHPTRIEALDRFPVDLITARACAPLSQLLRYSAQFQDGQESCTLRGLFLKGKNLEEELTAARKEWNMTLERYPSRSDPTGAILQIGIEGRANTRS